MLALGIGLVALVLVVCVLRFSGSTGGMAALLGLVTLPVLSMWLLYVAIIRHIRRIAIYLDGLSAEGDIQSPALPPILELWRLSDWVIERQRMVVQLRRSEYSLRTLVENLPDPIFRYDRDCRRTYASPAVERISGKKSIDLLGHTPVDVPLASALENEKLLLAIRNVLDTGLPIVVEVEYCAPDGQISHYQNHFGPEFASDGSVVGVLSIMRDITERRRLEDTLIERERSFRTLAENSPDFICRYDRDCRRLYVNSAVGHKIGKPVGVLIGASPADGPILIFEQNQRLLQIIREVFDSGESAHTEFDYVDEDGRHCDYHMLLVPEWGAGGQVITVLTFARDITAVRDAERQMSRFLFQMPGFAYSLRVSPDGHSSFPFISAGIEEFFGLKPADVRDDVAPIQAMMHPEDRCRVQGVYVDAASGMTSMQIEFRVLRPGYPERWLEAHCTPEREADGSLLWHGIVLEITERKRTEQVLAIREREFRTLAENLPDNIVRYDRQFRAHYVNPAMALSVAADYMPVLSSAIGDSAPCPEGGSAYRRLLEHVMATGEVAELEFCAPHPNGEIRVHHVRMVAEYDDDQIVGVLTIGRDVSERAKAEQTIRNLSADWKATLQALPDLLFETDINGTYLQVWAHTPELLAQRKELLLGRTCSEVLAPDATAVVMAALREAHETGSSYGQVMRLALPDGEHWFELSISRKIDPHADGPRFILLSRDISERKNTERALEEARNRLLGVLQSIPDLVWLKDVEGRYLVCNHAFERFFGAAEAEIIGKTDYEFVDSTLADFFRSKDRAAMEAGCVCLNEEWVTMADDGRRALLETRKVPLYASNGEAVGVLGIGRDVTERKRLEAELVRRESEFRSLVENSPDVIVRYDVKGRRIYCNSSYSGVSGVPGAELLGKTMAEYFPFPADIASTYSDLVRQVIDSAQVGELELNWRQEDVPVCFHIRVNPEFDATGRVTSVLAVGRNVSTLKQAEERLRKSHDILRALAAHQETEHEKERQDLAHQIHEDLAQNLSALRMNLALFEMSGDVSLLSAMRGIADSSIARIRDIVSMLRPTVLDLGLVPALRWLSDDFKGIGLQFELDMQEDIQLCGEVSVFLFRAAQAVLINVVLHAVATRVHMLFQATSNICCLTVRDNGCGFDTSAPRSEKAFGLIGLSEQARHLGGELLIDSAPGIGTVVKIRVPCRT